MRDSPRAHARQRPTPDARSRMRCAPTGAAGPHRMRDPGDGSQSTETACACSRVALKRTCGQRSSASCRLTRVGAR